MAKKNLLQKFTKSILSKKETSTLKGGKNYEPTNTGSYGAVNWDDITVRDGMAVSINVIGSATSTNIGEF